MDTEQVTALQVMLADSSWLRQVRSFAHALRGAVLRGPKVGGGAAAAGRGPAATAGRGSAGPARSPGGLLIVGTPGDEPWHLAAHLDDESRLSGMPGLAPTLVRWSPPPGAPPHLRSGLDRLTAARRGETVLVVSTEPAPPSLLERIHDARRAATILTMDTGDPDLDEMAHEALVVDPGAAPVSFDAAQHLVSASAGEPSPTRISLRGRLARLLDTVAGPSAP